MQFVFVIPPADEPRRRPLFGRRARCAAPPLPQGCSVSFEMIMKREREGEEESESEREMYRKRERMYGGLWKHCARERETERGMGEKGRERDREKVRDTCRGALSFTPT